MLGFLAKPEVADVKGLFYGGGFAQLWDQVIGLVAVGIYTIVLTFIIFKIVDALAGLRVSKDEETEGLDETIHGEKAYTKEY